MADSGIGRNGVSERLAVDVPEADYGRVSTIERFVAYLDEKLNAHVRRG